MGTATTLPDYRARLGALLSDAQAALPPERFEALTDLVRDRRNRPRGGDTTESAADLRQRADAIVALLDDAGRALRPRETQELDDLVAGKEPVVAPVAPPSARLRGHGSRHAR